MRHGLLLWKVSSGGGASPLAGRGEDGVAVPGGGRRGAVACRPCHCSTRRGACLFGRLPAFYFSFNSAPIPPTPFPSGEGGDSKYISPGATAPGTPATGWDAALDLLLENWKLSPQVQQVPHGFRLRGCKGLRPLHKITLTRPLPAGKGVGGMGAKIFFHPKNPAGRSSQCRTGTSRIQNPQQKRLSRFCKTQNPSRHPIQQGNHGSGRQRKSSAK